MEAPANRKPDESRVKHLEMIQTVVTRMAGNSFLIKSWCVTLVSALLALASKETNHTLVFIAYLPVFVMWILDAFFLRQERLYRKLYDERRMSLYTATDFAMDTGAFQAEVGSWFSVMLSKTLGIFYISMIIALLLATVILRHWHIVIKSWLMAGG